MGIEEYGGSCPHCQKAMLQKWESSGGFMFDACVWCGFADGTQWIEDEKGVYIGNSTPEYIWAAILEHHDVETREELPQALSLEPYVSEADSEFWPSIFDYSKLHTAREKRESVAKAQHNFDTTITIDLKNKIKAAYDKQLGAESHVQNQT